MPGPAASTAGQAWTPPASPHSGRERGDTFRIALLAGLLSAVVTVTASFATFRLLWPAAFTSVPVPTATPTSSFLSTPSPLPTLAPTATPAVEPAGGSDTVAATARVLPAVVTITTQTPARRGTIEGVGSGFLVDANGWILTNRHVVSGAATISVTLADGRVLPGQLYGVSSTNDLAVVKVSAGGLPTISLGDSGGLQLGQTLIVIGSPLGEYPGSVSTGVVSGLGRAIDIQGVERLTNLIQTDAAINPGNSGGPVVDLSGDAVGIATATSGGAQGISFAIPIADARSTIALALAGQPIP